MRKFYREEADDGRLVDTELLSHAIAFAAAADAYCESHAEYDWKVLYFLMARSMELALKAYALHKGANLQKLLKLGHDIVGILAHARQNDLELRGKLSNQDEKSIATLSLWYSNKYLEYPLIRVYAFPQPRIVREILDNVIASVFVAVHGEDQYVAHCGDRDRNHGLRIGANYG